MVNLDFAGADEGVFPASWSQIEFWRTINEHRPGGFYQLWWAVRVPARQTLDDVLDCLRRLVVRHQALRTRVREDDDGTLWQMVSATGRLPVRVEEIDDPAKVDSSVKTIWTEFLAGEPDLQREFPLKMAVVTHEGCPLSVAFACSHVVCDGGSVEVLVRELNELLATAPEKRDEVLGPVVYEPKDQARDESLESAQKTSRRSVSYWKSTITKAKPGVFSHIAGGRAPLWLGYLTSSALGAAERHLVNNARLASASVYLSAASCVFARLTGKTEMTFRVPTSNRFTLARQRYVGALSQHAVVNIDLSPATFHDLARLVDRKLLKAYCHTHYNPDDLRAAIRETESPLGAKVDLTYLFNDLRTEADKKRVSHPTGVDADPASEDTDGDSSISWDLLHTTNSDIKLYVRLQVSPHDGRSILDIAADESCLTRHQIEKSLLAVERLIVSAAHSDFSLADIDRVAGL